MNLDQDDKDRLAQAVTDATPDDSQMVTFKLNQRYPLRDVDFWELQDRINAACAAKAGAWGYALPVSNVHESQAICVLISVRGTP